MFKIKPPLKWHMQKPVLKKERVSFLAPTIWLGTPAGKLIFLICISYSGGSSSRRKVQTSHFAKRFARLNARFHQLPAPNRWPSVICSNQFRTHTQKAHPFSRMGFIFGSDYLIRTDDRSVNSRLLYRWAKSEYVGGRYRNWTDIKGFAVLCISHSANRPLLVPNSIGDLHIYKYFYRRQ